MSKQSSELSLESVGKGAFPQASDPGLVVPIHPRKPSETLTVSESGQEVTRAWAHQQDFGPHGILGAGDHRR